MDRLEQQRREEQKGREYQHAQAAGIEDDSQPAKAAQLPQRRGPKVGRNDLCTCGSGKKYKHCCGKI